MALVVKKNAQGQITEMDYFASDGKTLTEVDKFTNGLIQSATRYAADGKTVVSVTFYSYTNSKLTKTTTTSPSGVIQSVTIFNTDGKTISELDTYIYSSSGALSKILQSNNQGLLLRQIQYAADGKTITEIDLYGYDSKSKLTTVYKANGQGKIVEEDDYSSGVLTQVKYFDSNGRLITLNQYATDGVTLTSVLSNTYDTAGKLVTTTLKNGSGVVQEVDQFTYYAFGYQTKSRYGANGKLFEVDYLFGTQVLATKFFDANGKTTEMKYFDGNGILLEDDFYASGVLSSVYLYQQGQLNQVVYYSVDGKTITEVDRFKKNVLSIQDIYANGRLQTENIFGSDGKTITATDTYSYNAAGQIDQIVKSASGVYFENDKYIYDSKNQLTEIDKSNAAGVITEIDYFKNGKLVRVDKQPVSSTPATHKWSITSGWGEANVLNALNLVTGKKYSAVTAPSGTATYLGQMNFQAAWANGFTGQGVVIADIDTGIDLKNTALIKNLNLSKYNWNFITGTADVQDDNGHGTCTAGELVAQPSTNNIEGGAYGAQLMVLKAMSASGAGIDTNIAAAVKYAVDHGANVINMSLGSTSADPLLQSAIQYASDHGTIVCVSAGNNSGASPTYPAAYAQTITDEIAVGATQLQSSGAYSMASFSNQAGSATAYNYVDALGVGITGYGLGGKIYSWNGTSMAAPLIAAEAADLLCANNFLHLGLTAAQIVQDIMQSASALDATTQATSTVSALNTALAQGLNQQIQMMGSITEPQPSALTNYVNNAPPMLATYS